MLYNENNKSIFMLNNKITYVICTLIFIKILKLRPLLLNQK